MPVTDVKHISHRRMCYVGFKTPADAAKAVKYFNKSFIRTSRIVAQKARPIADPRYLQPHANAVNIPTEQSNESVKNIDAITQSTKKRKRDDGSTNLQEFLDVMEKPSKVKSWKGHDAPHIQVDTSNDTTKALPTSEVAQPNEPLEAAIIDRNNSSQPKSPPNLIEVKSPKPGEGDLKSPTLNPSTNDHQQMANLAPMTSDDDWLRSRTSRLLGLLDDDEVPISKDVVAEERSLEVDVTASQQTNAPETADAITQADITPADDSIQSQDTQEAGREHAMLTGGRLFIRNLAYSTTQDDLRNHFESQGAGLIEEVHVPLDPRSGSGKGFAYVQYSDPLAAGKALAVVDGTSFQGRLLHVMAAAPKKQAGLDEFTLSRLPLKKQQQIRRKAEAASSTFSWNALFMNADTVVSSISERLGVPKAQILDPTSSDAAVRQAHAETHLIQETKMYFSAHGVNLDSFRNSARGDTAILVKNFSYETKASDLQALFGNFGPVSRLLLPPSGTIAIVEFKHADDARAAFAGLAYRKIKDSILFLEKAPRDVFGVVKPQAEIGAKGHEGSTSALEGHDTQNSVQSSTLFIRNLNFSTSTERLRELFSPLEGFLSARVKQKPDPKKAGQSLSMGFGFVEFHTKQQAQTALAAMDDYNLDGHKLLVRASQRVTDAAEERRTEDRAKALAGRKTKVIIKNLPFEASRKDVRSLLGPYGQLRSVRVPKKFDTSTRGFAFAEFVTAKEAENAVDALRDTHLLGRRLIFEFAAEDTLDPEQAITEMQKKVGKQADKVALQRLIGTGRKKFSAEGGEEE